MGTTVRLDKALEADLEAVAQQEGVTKSVVIKRSIAAYVARVKHERSSFELGEQLFGRWASGDSDRGTNRKAHLEGYLREKVSRRLGSARRPVRSQRGPASRGQKRDR